MFRMFAMSLFFVSLLFLASGCNKKMKDEDFIRLYVRIARATEQYLDQPDRKTAAHQKIFAESGFTKQDFEDYQNRYNEQPEKWLAVWQEIEKQLQLPATHKP